MSVSTALRVVSLNLAFDSRHESPPALLAAYHTLTGWSLAVAGAGATVRVVQRFARDARCALGGVEYDFVKDGADPTPASWARLDRTAAAVAAATPDVVHVNGLMFPGMVAALRRRMPTTPIVVQDHAGVMPRRRPWPLQSLPAAWWRRAFASVDACTFTAAALAEPWYHRGLPRAMPILEIPEASTHVGPSDRRAARLVTGLSGRPVILWVGRLDANKDPLTALDALERALPRLPGARCAMVWQGGGLEARVRRRISRSPVLCDQVGLVGAVAHAGIADYYTAADIFLSASRHEGSGYALIESMACGAVPCVTDIPAFRALAGDCGARWQAGDAESCAYALTRLAARNLTADGAAVRRRFSDHLSWPVIGRRTVAEYHALVHQRRSP